jgi:hypothetical protein
MEEKSDSLAVIDDARKQAQLEVTANFRKATSVAGLCKAIVLATAVEIQGNKYVPAASWEAIAVAHGYVVSTRDVEYVKGAGTADEPGFAGGFRAIAEIKNQNTGMVIATAEGFVGEDEPVWFGGTVKIWKNNRYEEKTYQKRHDSAIRAMCQTRAAGRVCKQAFAHVVVLMNANLSTTPLEEISDPDSPENNPGGPKAGDTTKPPMIPIDDWRNVRVHFGQQHGPGCDAEHLKGKQLGELSTAALTYFQTKWQPKPWKGKPISEDDRRLRYALDISMGKIKPEEKRPDFELTNADAPAKSANAEEEPPA